MRSTEGGAYWAEWRPNMRIRGQPVAEWPSDPAKRSAMPLPYAATFVEAIASELAAFPNVAETHGGGQPLTAAAPGFGKGRKIGLAILFGVIIIGAIIAATIGPGH